MQAPLLPLPLNDAHSRVGGDGVGLTGGLGVGAGVGLGLAAAGWAEPHPICFDTNANGTCLQNAMTSSEERASAEAEGYRIERSLMDCVRTFYGGGGDAIHQ